MRLILLSAVVAAGITVSGAAETVAPLTGGEHPVGRWECWLEERDLAETANSNKWFAPPGCNVALFADASVVEMHADGVGYILGIKRTGRYEYQSFDYGTDRFPCCDGAEFRVRGLPGVQLSRVQEIRWALEPGGGWKSCHEAAQCLRITTKRHERYSFEVVTDDVLRITDDHYGTRRLLFRLGSPASRLMLAFRACVAANRGQALFRVKECRTPLID